ncbi:MAG: DUF6766 family protein [Actinomycetota bacterium]
MIEEENLLSSSASAGAAGRPSGKKNPGRFHLFGLSIVLGILFLGSWVAQGFSEWETYKAEQEQHGQPTEIKDFFYQFSQSTTENWQSEFLQLFTMAVLTGYLIQKSSAESSDSDERVEESLARIEKRLAKLENARK